MPRLSRPFFARPAKIVARDLLGCTLVRILPSGTRLAGMIVETEAYVGVKDAGCHSHKGRRTPKNEAMYKQGGTFYVYFTYGMHFCCNVVCGGDNEPVAVLLRALEPVEGVPVMAKRRGIPAAHPLGKNVCDGPGKLCQAMGIERSDNGADLVSGDSIWIESRMRGMKIPRIVTGPRIGLSTETVWKNRVLRFGIKDHRCLSKPFPTGKTRNKKTTSKSRG